MKSLVRLVVGYAVGVLLVGSWLVSQGDAIGTVTRLLVAWLPIAAAYAAIAATLVRFAKVSRLAGMFELCGLCIGLFPLFSGLWPTYSLRWDLAIFMVAIQFVALAATITGVFAVSRLIGSIGKPDGPRPGTMREDR